MGMLPGDAVYVPGLGVGLVLRVDETVIPERLWHIRFGASQSEVVMPESVAAALGVRRALDARQATQLLGRIARGRLPSTIKTGKWLLSPRPEDLFRILQAELIGELPEDAWSHAHAAQARRLLTMELSAATLESEESIDGKLRHALASWREWNASRELTETAAAYLAPPLEVADHVRPFTYPVPPMPGVTGFSARPLPPEDQLRFIRHLRQMAGDPGLGPVLIEPHMVSCTIPEMDVHRHAAALIRSDRTLPVPANVSPNTEVVFVCLYPSGAVRTSSCVRSSAERASLEDPLSLLDPDVDPDFIDGLYIHRLLVVGFELVVRP